MEIKDSEAVFDINVLGDRTNQSYMGTFRVKCLLSPLEEIEADKIYRELLGPNSHLAQEHVRQQAFALAQLDQRLIEFPAFWENAVLGGGHIKDRNVVMEVLDKAIQAQEQYVKGKEKELEQKQKRLAQMIKSKKIKKIPENDEEDPADEEIDLGDAKEETKDPE